MRPVTRYSLQPSEDRDGGRRVLARDGRTLAAEVDGSVLDAQLELADGSALLWLTDDSPYDEGLHVYLLGPEGVVDDAVEAGADFTAGVLALRAMGEDWVEFGFFKNSTVYRLEVANTPRLRLRLPTGWKYKKRLGAHRLAVREVDTTGGK
jgi:hypothetical protein